MILTTTSNLEGHRITEYLGVVTGEAVLGTNIFRDFFARFVMWSGDGQEPMKRSWREPAKRRFRIFKMRP